MILVVASGRSSVAGRLSGLVGVFGDFFVVRSELVIEGSGDRDLSFQLDSSSF